MRIGIIYDDIARDGLDCSRPELGNPGVGGTQFCYLMLLKYYPIQFPEDKLIVYRHRKIDHLPPMPNEDIVEYKIVHSISECVEMAKKDKIDILLATVGHTMELSKEITDKKLKTVIWIHNWIRNELLNELAENNMFKRAIFLGDEHYDRYYDHRVIRKAVIIPNMFNTESYEIRNNNLEKNVTYVGGLVNSKGFDALAKCWKQVIAKVPSANLYVIGTGTLYGTNMKMGKLGIADEKFESIFAPHITDETGKVLPSVHFMGLVGSEKADIYKKTKVGIVNPTGRTEVCPISALEMEAAEIPVISKRTNGLPDVVEKDTGVLINKEKELADTIVKLLQDDHLNEKLGKHARKLVEDKFSPTKIVEIWHKMFEEVNADKDAVVRKPFKNYNNNFKWLRIIQQGIKRIPFCSNLPAIIDIEGFVSKKLRGQ